jgi:hypothetical protein
MTKTGLAEWILSQVLPPDRAASTVGDWMEDVDKRGNIWFWSCVIRTVVSHVWSGLTESPASVARLGLLGYARYSLVIVGMAALWNVFLVSHYHHAIHRWPFDLAVHLTWFSLAFQTGRWIARRARGREISVCAVVVFLGWASLFVQELTLWQRGVPASYINLTGVAHDLVLLAGALCLRRRQLHPVG